MQNTVIEEKVISAEEILDVGKIRRDFPILKEEFTNSWGREPPRRMNRAGPKWHSL
ncbi:MAG: hypothetical protein P8Y60_06810 [Calditrichota bacterium]